MKKFLIMLIAGACVFTAALPAQAQVRVPAVYVALGDSLAAGQTPASEIDAGYADLIAQELARQQPVAFYTKDLAFPGFTTEDVLERIQSEEAAEVLKQANIITLSAGANDLLRLVQSNAAEGSLAFEQIQTDFAMNTARENTEAILAELSERAPDADVYVMGYYFPYPHARDSQKAGVKEQLDRLNEILRRSAERAGAVFVPVSDAFGTDAKGKIPNPADVHPNVKGYQAMANAFLKAYGTGWKVENYELPAPQPVSFEDIMAAQEQETEGSTKTPDGSAARPSDEMETDYLAIKGPLLYI